MLPQRLSEFHWDCIADLGRDVIVGDEEFELVRND